MSPAQPVPLPCIGDGNGDFRRVDAIGLQAEVAHDLAGGSVSPASHRDEAFAVVVIRRAEGQRLGVAEAARHTEEAAQATVG